MRQEFFGWVLAQDAVRWPLHEGAAASGQGDDELSFASHVQLLRRTQPPSGAFPPKRPRLRSHWFNGLLRESGTLRCVRTLNTQRPRMVKRRNSPYAPHQRDVPSRQPCDFTPKITAPTGRRPPPPSPPPRDEGPFAGSFII